MVQTAFAGACADATNTHVKGKLLSRFEPTTEVIGKGKARLTQ
jgi:hypothetical protein